MNIQIFYDLLISIKSPFKDRDMNIKFFYIFDIFVFVGTYYYHYTDIYKGTERKDIYRSPMLLTIFAALVIGTIVIKALIYWILCKKSTPKELKNVFCKRHFFYDIVVFY
jgi:hypothetical protein